MTPLDQAIALVRSRCSPLPAEDVPLDAAAGRVLAEAVTALYDQPATDLSMMDGYALRLAEAGGALRVAGEVAAGDVPWDAPLPAGIAARIFTGAPVPAGADCVVMQEHAAREGALVRVREAPRPGQHIRRRGEELRAGAIALEPGTVLSGAHASLAGSCGATRLRVCRRPRVALLATGDELVAAGTPPRAGQIVETNSLSLAPLCREAGAEVQVLGIEGDDAARIAARLAAADADILVTTGGASVGDHDHAQEALERISGQLVFHRVAIRPGKPMLFGVAGARLVFGLPGNPAASTLCFELFVRVAIRALQGDPHPERAAVPARLASRIGRVKNQTFFPRGRLRTEGNELVFDAGAQQSSMQIASWTNANAVARIEPGDGSAEPGDVVPVIPIGPLT